MEDFLNLRIPIILVDDLKAPLSNLQNRPIGSVFQELGIDPTRPINEQKPNPFPARKALDDIVFDILGLTKEERNEVYWSVTESVKNRLEKAKSL